MEYEKTYTCEGREVTIPGGNLERTVQGVPTTNCLGSRNYQTPRPY
jgi:hypothetical protein